LTIVKSILINFEPILIILYFVKLLGPYRGEGVKLHEKNAFVEKYLKIVKIKNKKIFKQLNTNLKIILFRPSK